MAIVRGIYEAINSAGAAMLALPDETRREFFQLTFDPELELRQHPDIIIGTKGTFRGYEGFVAATEELFEALSRVEFEPQKEFVRGEIVVFDVRAVATGRASGARADVRVGHLWELRDGLVTRWIVYPTLDEALEAAGLW